MKHLKFISRLFLVLGLFFVIWKSVTYLSKRNISPLPEIGQSASFPSLNPAIPFPLLTAKNIFVLDRKSKLVLYQHEADTHIYPASTTKMMTAIVAHENMSLDQIIEVKKTYPEGVDINLQPGEKIRVSDLLYATLVQSANDAAEVLAESYPGGRPAFVTAMNNKVAELKLLHTHFQNPTGLDETDHYSSAADLARIADYLLISDYLSRIVSTENAVVSSADFSAIHPISNVNQLLGRVSGVVGIKTGFTDLAGEALITLVNRGNHEVIISLLGSTDRFADTTKLIDWIYSAFTWSD